MPFTNCHSIWRDRGRNIHVVRSKYAICEMTQQWQRVQWHVDSLSTKENGCENGDLGHVMMTSSNGNISCVTDPLCRDFPGHRWIPLTKAVTRSFDVLVDYLFLFIVVYSPDGIVMAFIPFGIILLLLLLLLLSYLETLMRPVLPNILWWPLW